MKLSATCSKEDIFVVSGASSGIGFATCKYLAENGAIIIGIARNEEKLKKSFKELPGEHSVLPLDICNSQQLAKELIVITSKIGVINGFVHCAGVNHLTPLRSFNEEKAQTIVNTTIFGAISLIRAVSQPGVFNVNGTAGVLVSSVAAKNIEKGLIAYSAAKAGLNSLAKTASLELSKKKFRINTISPGWVKTPLTDKIEKTVGHSENEQFKEPPLGVGSIESVVETITFLISNSSRWITGADIVVDGGYSLT